MTEYNPFKDFNPVFTRYQSLKPEKVEIEDFLGNKTNISDWADNVLPNGNIIASPNTPEAKKEFDASFLDENAKTHSEEILTYDETPSKNLPTKGNLVDNAKFAYSYLIKKGIPKSSAAGIVGNLWNENLRNPLSTVKDAKNTTAYGIAGFNSKGDLPNLLKWSKENGIQGNPNFQQQLDYLIHCINTRPRLQILLNGKLSTKEASFIWGSEFERFRGQTNNGRGYANINDPEHKKRAATAKTIFETYQS